MSPVEIIGMCLAILLGAWFGYVKWTDKHKVPGGEEVAPQAVEQPAEPSIGSDMGNEPDPNIVPPTDSRKASPGVAPSTGTPEGM